jgi:hypothetical protein
VTSICTPVSPGGLTYPPAGSRGKGPITLCGHDCLDGDTAHRDAPAYLFFGVKRIDDATYRDEIDRLAGELAFTMIYVVADPPPG